jgi:hypothetical protein
MHPHLNFSLKPNPNRHPSSTTIIDAPCHHHHYSEPLLPN